jgi:hypothetical protein
VFLHNVHYWLKPDLTPEQRDVFFEGIRALMKLKSVRCAWFGAPAEGGEVAADRSYSYALVLGLADAAGHDEFQADPEHHAIRARIGGSWEKILIYDIDSEWAKSGQ